MKKKGKRKAWQLIMFLASAGSLVISVNLFYNMGIFVDEHNLSPDVVLGGDFWLSMDWLRLALLAVLSGLSLINLFSGAAGEEEK